MENLLKKYLYMRRKFKMKKNEKRGIIISTTVTIMGLIGIVYTTIMKNNVEDTISMYSSGITLLTLGLILVLYYHTWYKH